MGRIVTLEWPRRASVAAVVSTLLTGLLVVAPWTGPVANAAPGTIVYGSTFGIDTTGTSGCLTTSDFCSLQGAFDAAAALSSGTVAIYLEDAGTSNTYQGESNALYSFDDPGLDVTVQPDPSLGAGAAAVFDARYLPGTSILTLTGSGSVTLDDVTMQNGDAMSSGGAIRISSDLTVSVNDATFDNNQSIANSNGGAIGVDNGTTAQLDVNDSTFNNNWAIGVGGAIGGYDNNGTTTITDSTFSDNHGDYGGAIGEGAAGAGTLDVTGSTFEGNSAIWGGAIDNADIGGSSNAVVQDSTFVDNVASTTGGEIANSANFGTGNLVVLRSSFNDGAGTTPAIAGDGGTTVFAGSVVAGSDAALCEGTISDAGYNLEADSSASCGFTASSDASPGSLIGFAALANNGGNTLSEELSAASPAAAAIPSSPATSVSINATPYVLCTNPDADQTGVSQSTLHGCSLGALDATYLAVQSTPSVVAPQMALTATQAFSLAATGGAGRANYTFGTSTPGCSLQGTTLSFTGTVLPTTCEVSVSNAASGPYLASASSPDQAFIFVAAPQAAPLVVTSTTGVFATPLVVSASGGSGNGATTFTVLNGTATGCELTSAAPYALTSSSAGTCVVQASKAASGLYQSAISAPTIIAFAATTPQAPSIRLSSQHAGVAFVAVTVQNLGGDPQTALQYSLDGGRWRAAIRQGHGLIEVTGVHRHSRTTIQVRVYTDAGRSAGSSLLRFKSH